MSNLICRQINQADLIKIIASFAALERRIKHATQKQHPQIGDAFGLGPILETDRASWKECLPLVRANAVLMHMQLPNGYNHYHGVSGYRFSGRSGGRIWAKHFGIPKSQGFVRCLRARSVTSGYYQQLLIIFNNASHAVAFKLPI